jgi:hypothetical protein
VDGARCAVVSVGAVMARKVTRLEIIAMVLYVIGLLAVIWAVWPAVASASPCRPNGTDLTARLNTGSALQSFPMSGYPHTSSQSERDCLDLASLDYVHALVIAAGDLAPNATKKAIDAMNLAFTRILVVAPYRGALQSPGGGQWIVPVQGRLYQVQQITFDAFAYELTSSRIRAAASARFTTMPDLRNVLDVDASFGATRSAPFTLPPPPPLDTKRAGLFPVDTRTKVPACGNGDCTGLAKVHAAHACVAAAKLAGQPTSGCPSPQLEHVFYELGCKGDERCEAFRRIAPFRGDEDRRNLDTTQLHILYALQDRDHLAWMNAQALGDWKASDKASIRHLLGHSMMNVADSRRLVVYPCDIVGTSGPVDPEHGRIADFQDVGSCFGGKQSIATLLVKLAAAYGLAS